MRINPMVSGNVAYSNHPSFKGVGFITLPKNAFTNPSNEDLVLDELLTTVDQYITEEKERIRRINAAVGTSIEVPGTKRIISLDNPDDLLNPKSKKKLRFTMFTDNEVKRLCRVLDQNKNPSRKFLADLCKKAKTFHLKHLNQISRVMIKLT